MSERAIAFVEDWVSDNVHATGYLPEGDTAIPASLAEQCLSDAKAEGITEAEMKDAFEDLPSCMAAQIQDVNDRAKDD
jgi:hypothetical protein